MARVKGAMMTRKRRNKTLKLAKGYFGAKSKHFKMAKQAVMKSGQYAYIGRKQKKRDFRKLSGKISVKTFPYSLCRHRFQLQPAWLQSIQLLFSSAYLHRRCRYLT